MISVIFCSRVKDNPDSNIKQFLDSAVEHIRPEERDQVEFLIKYDSDDDQRPPEEFFAAYPFKIRTFVYARGEGRHSLHNAQEFLFTQRDPRTRFLLMTADDFRFTRTGFVTEILSHEEEFCVLGPIRPPIEAFAGIYEEEQAIRRWVYSMGALCPVLSVKFIEVCQNFGWQANVDSWVIALSIVLYDVYGLILWRTHEPFYRRGGGHGLGDTPTYNNLELTGLHGPENKYWFELLRRQARNLYLNIHHGTAHRPAWAPLRLWTKVRAKPLRRLPARVYRKVVRDLRSLLLAPRESAPVPQKG